MRLTATVISQVTNDYNGYIIWRSSIERLIYKLAANLLRVIQIFDNAADLFVTQNSRQSIGA
jgi:hypothetical protein